MFHIAVVVGASLSVVPQPRGPVEKASAPIEKQRPPRKVIVVGVQGQIDEVVEWNGANTCEGEALAFDVAHSIPLYCYDGRWEALLGYEGTAFVVDGTYSRQSVSLATPTTDDFAGPNAMGATLSGMPFSKPSTAPLPTPFSTAKAATPHEDLAQ